MGLGRDRLQKNSNSDLGRTTAATRAIARSFRRSQTMNSLRHRILVFRHLVLACTALAAAMALLLAIPTARSQTSSATLDGTVPGAKVTLQNQASGDVRTGISNGQGFFTFAAVP